MADDPGLRALIERASEQVDTLFDPADPMLAHILAEGSDGKLTLCACPMSSVEEEAMFRLGVPAILRRSGAYRGWVFYTEAWTAEYDRAAPDATLPVDRPDRMEVVVFAAESARGARLKASRQIHRTAQGARLLPLVFDAPDRSHAFVMGAATGVAK